MRFARSIVATFAAAALTGALAAPAAALAGQPPAARGTVIVFTLEGDPLKFIQDPHGGCNDLPALSHLVLNLTDRRLTLYFDPLCIFPVPFIGDVRPGYGGHPLSPAGGFRVG
ncbi:hypothetical protein [Actinokineospora sp. NBRC 105648]|uniref:hypothetical protein n=1 Tax=Actinokineospora sp. NBRC 105648 TaxID=3032206 RepID=UPI0024A17AE4|nr:hypothetical protein [Actinokineospora sp. NBRC 105648]GLZ36432.1 hypothetical protein Acsp05_00570 [Actinokineospora sp. NBRC 105648]